jgi:hypothetical protein
LEPLSSAKDLETELDSIMAQLSRHIETIGTELDKPFKSDAAKIRMTIGSITMLTHKFMQFLPKVGTARDAEIRAQGPLPPSHLHRWSNLSSRLYKERTWLTQWPKIETLVRLQLPSKQRKLYRNENRTEDITVSQLSVYDGIFEDIHKILNPAGQTDFARNHGCFADIPLPHSVFMAHMHAAHRVLLAMRLRHPTRFLDVGCGGGLKVLSATKFFDRANGLEFDPTYVTAAQDLFNRSSSDTCRVFQADGLVHEGYDQYDVIYFYRPMRDNELLNRLENQIIKFARPGTLIVAPYLIFEARYKSLGCGKIDDYLYITQTSQTDAKDLRRRAEMTGPFVRNKAPRAASIWDPILTASQSMGFGLEL